MRVETESVVTEHLALVFVVPSLSAIRFPRLDVLHLLVAVTSS